MLATVSKYIKLFFLYLILAITRIVFFTLIIPTMICLALHDLCDLIDWKIYNIKNPL